MLKNLQQKFYSRNFHGHIFRKTMWWLGGPAFCHFWEVLSSNPLAIKLFLLIEHHQKENEQKKFEGNRIRNLVYPTMSSRKICDFSSWSIVMLYVVITSKNPTYFFIIMPYSRIFCAVLIFKDFVWFRMYWHEIIHLCTVFCCIFCTVLASEILNPSLHCLIIFSSF